MMQKHIIQFKDFLLKRNFELEKWQSEGLYFTEIFKRLNNGIKIEMTITHNSDLEYHSHTFAISIENNYSEIAIESFEEFESLVKILDK
jgi:hypothetical protein